MRLKPYFDSLAQGLRENLLALIKVNNRPVDVGEDGSVNLVIRNVDVDTLEQIEGQCVNAASNAADSSQESRIWAEGTDEEVQAFGGVKSSKGYSEVAANKDLSNLSEQGYSRLDNSALIEIGNHNEDPLAHRTKFENISSEIEIRVREHNDSSDAHGLKFSRKCDKDPNTGLILSYQLPDDLVRNSSLGDGKITIKQGGVTKGSFTVNQKNDLEINVDAVSEGGGGGDVSLEQVESKISDHNNNSLAHPSLIESLSRKATLLDGKVMPSQLPAVLSETANVRLDNLSPSGEDRFSSKADLVDGIVPISQLPGLLESTANKSLNNLDPPGEQRFSSKADLVDGVVPVSQLPTAMVPGNGLVTITQDGTEKGSFRLNQYGDVSIDLYTLPGANKDLSNLSARGNDVLALKADLVAGKVNKSQLPAGKLTIKQNGETKATFSANQNTEISADIITPKNISDLPNNVGYVTKAYVDQEFSKKQNTIDVDHKLPVSYVSGLKPVATSGSYNDLDDKPAIPAAQVQSDWNQTNSSAVDYIKNKPAISAEGANTSLSNLTSEGEARFTSKADLVDGIVPISQLPGLLESAANKSLNNLDSLGEQRFNEKVNQGDYQTHVSNSNIHVTSEEKNSWNGMIEEATQKANAAASWAEGSDTDVGDLGGTHSSKGWATQAAGSATAASGSKDAAAASATTATQKANAAASWAEGSDTDVGDLGGTHSAKGWAEQAATSVTTATQKANEASIWARGTDEEVQALGGEKSSKGYMEQATALKIQVLSGTNVVVDPSKCYSWQVSGNCTITFGNNWKIDSLECSEVRLSHTNGATLSFPSDCIYKGDEFSQQSESFVLGISHDPSGFLVVGLRRS